MPPEDQRAEVGAEGAPSVTIVRYPNRRLYDRSQGRYVTLPELAALVREGKTVSVRDSKTDEDLTRQILTQIILDQHPERMDLFPVPVLHLMIRANDIALGFLRDYMRQSLVYLELWNRAASLNPWAAPLEWLRTLIPGRSPPGDTGRPASGFPTPRPAAQATPTNWPDGSPNWRNGSPRPTERRNGRRILPLGTSPRPGGPAITGPTGNPAGVRTSTNPLLGPAMIPPPEPRAGRPTDKRLFVL